VNLERVTEIVLIARIIPLWRLTEDHRSPFLDEGEGVALIVIGCGHGLASCFGSWLDVGIVKQFPG